LVLSQTDLFDLENFTVYRQATPISTRPRLVQTTAGRHWEGEVGLITDVVGRHMGSGEGKKPICAVPRA
jgi:hypothetical protein